MRARTGEGALGSVERALHAGIARASGPFDAAFAMALRESGAELPPLPPTHSLDAVAAARLAVLAELDRPPQRPWRPGAFDGLVGGVSGDRDPRRAPPYISTVEDVSRCAWQAFLRRLLRLEAPPDPLAAMPAIDARLIGMTVHGALEELIGSRLDGNASSFDDLAEREATAVVWPDVARVDAVLDWAAKEVLRKEGIALAGLAAVLVRQARPYVARAGALDWESPGARVDVLGVEVEGAVRIPGRTGAMDVVRFRADRVDRIGGALRVTDYKTGRPLSDAKRDSTRENRHREEVAAGSHLQAAAYALGAPEGEALGRLLYLRPDLDPSAAAFDVRGDDDAFTAAFAAAVTAIGTAWERGAVGPRLLDKSLRSENPACERCEVAIACVRGDSGARGRLEAWLQSASLPTESPDLWRLRAGPARHELTETS